ncbi:ribonuclease P protein component [Aliarcobacter thereius]|uniref:Ribonuclease P protein component n=1 Tax=Aliarcobacter thereius TaxID=544718 RepID=A0A5R9H575_9BACT|nr:ribonuclease P protein component [Aliarcobacter thereius]TLS71538.1 ribonuclease P protein component [Aliarcobacter thereius]TLT06177.1 ribonuclease P protein component [Aliarcobacter thereius]
MSCLSKEYRLNTQKEFNKLYKSGKSWHTPSFVAFFIPNNKFKLAFVASKKIGNAVARNSAKRRLRATLLGYEKSLKEGSYIFVAKKEIENKKFLELKKDFNFALKRLEVLK